MKSYIVHYHFNMTPIYSIHFNSIVQIKLSRFKFQICVGIVILFANSEVNSDTKNWKIFCELDSLHVFCATSNNQLPANHIPTIPLKNISEPEKVQTISIDLTTPRRGSCTINDHTMFHEFTNVFDIQFIGDVSISLSHNETEYRKYLTEELFNLPNLENVRLERWNQGDAFTWKFPNTIKSLQLIGHGYTRLDLSSYTNLHDLRLSENNLKTMPKLSFPSPPLENLDLSNNPELEITVYDIVELCKLEELYLNEIKVHVNETAKNCECKRLKKFMKEFRIDGTRNMYCSLETQCSGNNFEKLKTIHAEACNEDSNSNGYEDESASDSERREGYLILIMCILALYSIMITIYLFFNFIRQ